MISIYELTLLYDFYGPLLTEKQQKVMSLHLAEDLSLGEVAEELECSRQAVSDSLKKAKAALTAYEEKLGLVAKHLKAVNVLEELENAFSGDKEKFEELKQLIV